MSSRKRPFSDTLIVAEKSHRPPPSLRSASPFADAARMELEAVRAELEHERSLRALEARRFQQTRARLEQHLQVAMDDAQETKAVLEDTQRTSQAHVEQLRASRNDALRQLRENQEEMMASMENDGAVYVAQQEVDIAREKEQMYEAKIEAMTDEIEKLQKQLSAFEAQRDDDDDEENDDSTHEGLFAEPSHLGSLAPTTVMKELNKTRLSLAESERKYRQLVRKSEDWKQKSNRYAQQQEAARFSAARITQLEMQLRDDTKELEALRAENRSWNEFGKNLNQALGVTDKSKSERPGNLSTADHAGLPPEAATVIRLLENLRNEIRKSQKEKDVLHNEIQSYQNRLLSTKQQAETINTELVKSREQLENTKKSLEQSQHDIATIRAQEGIWKREADSLRSLMKTYDTQAITPPKKPGSEGTGMESGLSNASDEIHLLTKERTRLSEEVKSLQAQTQELTSQHASVVEKFKKIRTALAQEKEKAQQAEARAIKAEALTGQGHFNPDKSRAMHLKQNPLTEAIKNKYEQEINSLKKQLQKGGDTSSASATKSATPEVDPQKLHKRLKESFKEQIGLFREGVYLMTGYKVDMIQRQDNRPTFRVRSMYAEREQDHLIFVWPKASDDDAPTCLDLVGTEQAKELATTDSYAYMTKYNSLPAFLASVQLTLFEKQTLV